MDRRNFIKNSAILVSASALPSFAEAKETDAKQPTVNTAEQGRLIDSAPVLQNYAETSMGIAFSVTDMANGYVVYGREPDLSDGVKVYSGGYRMTDMNDQVMLVRLQNLEPATTYYYKIGADRINFKNGYDIHITGNEEDPTIYHFRTAGKSAGTHFCVINDTHARWNVFGKEQDKIAELRPDFVIWNGDACNTEETMKDLKRIYFHPQITRGDYAARTPYLFCPGNHDGRGLANRHPERVWMYRQPDERASRDWDLGRNFAVRTGDVAVIGLDTAEDKVDSNPKFCNLWVSEAYREAQTAWLKDALQRPEIKNAPFLVAFCHIPLFSSNPKENPGDIHPADVDADHSPDFAMWQRQCAQLWTPLLEKAGCQLIVTAHQHCFRYDAPTPERSWGHMVGGGCELPKNEADNMHFPTVIEGDVRDGKLCIRVHNIAKNNVCFEVEFTKRKGKKLKK